MDKIILFELNEVPFRVMDEFCKQHPQSVFAKIRPFCHEYITCAEDTGLLEPWITWPSVHRGVSNQKHQIHDYNQNLAKVNEQFPPIWQILCENQISTGVFSSLHSYPLPADISNYSFFIPDPFAPTSDCHPESISVFQEFNLSMARISGKNVSSKMLVKPAARMLINARSLGLKPRTFYDIGQQLCHEIVNPFVVRRRRTYQSVLSFDVFIELLAQKRPQFATYFTNHVASSMHRYWGATFPEDFQKEKLDTSWQKVHKDEINFAMQKFNTFLERLITFIDKSNEYKLIILGSMGQAATNVRPVKTMVMLKNVERFLNKMGLETGEWQVMPAMVPQFNIVVDSSKRAGFKVALSSLKVDGQSVKYRENEDGFFSLDFFFENIQSKSVNILDSTYDFEEVGLKAEELQDQISNTGWHIPEGAMLVYDGKSKQGAKEKRVSTLAICPSILQHFNVDVPSYMSNERVLEIVS